MLLFSQEPVVSWILPNPRLEAGTAARLSVQDAHFSEEGGGRVTTWHRKIGET